MWVINMWDSNIPWPCCMLNDNKLCGKKQFNPKYGIPIIKNASFLLPLLEIQIFFIFFFYNNQ